MAFAALRHSRRVVVTEGSPQALRLLERNVCANARWGVSVGNSAKRALFLASQCSRHATCSQLLTKSCRTRSRLRLCFVKAGFLQHCALAPGDLKEVMAEVHVRPAA